MTERAGGALRHLRAVRWGEGRLAISARGTLWYEVSVVGSSERDLGRYQMLWDCPSCDTPKLLGIDHRHCPNCGAAQDPKARYFPEEQDKVSAENHRYVGADKQCPACESPNAAIANNCTNCGSGLDGAKGVAHRQDQVAGLAGFDADSVKRAKAERRAGAEGAAAPPVAAKKSKLPWIAALAGVALFGSCMAIFFWKESADLEVVGHKWARTIQIEEFRAVADSAWKGSLPSGAYDVSCSREQRSTKQIPDGQECTKKRKDLKDGTYKEVEECKTKYRSEPVYDDKCRFKVDRWAPGRELKDEGGLDREPTWPKVQLARTGNCRGCEREGARNEEYEVQLRDGKTKSTDTCKLGRELWAGMKVGSKWVAERGVITKSLDCDALKPAK